MKALKRIDVHVAMHPALQDLFVKRYGYATDEEGIRHGIIDSERLDFAKAEHMVGACEEFPKYPV